MPRLPFLLLILGLLATHTPAGVILRSVTDLLSPGSGWVEDPNSPASPEPSPDSGWEIDPNG